MSIYENRDNPAYSINNIPISYCENKYIKEWWTEKHNELIKNQIQKEHWNWYWTITDNIEKITNEEIFEKWKNTDPLCQKYAWYNILMYFSIAQAKKLDYEKLIRSPIKKTCPICNQNFIESSIPSPFIKRLGIENLDFCTPCLTESFLSEGNEKMKKRHIIDYLIRLSQILNKVPSQNYIEEISNLSQFEMTDRLLILNHLRNKPSIKKIKSTFGSWFNALIESQILEDGTRKNSFGIQCLARDGHVCLSLGEKTIDDILNDLNYSHTKEPYYPESNYRGDFLVGEIVIEYFGLIGNKEYDEKVKYKRELAKKHNLKVIEIFPFDLVDTKELIKKLRKELN